MYLVLEKHQGLPLPRSCSEAEFCFTAMASPQAKAEARAAMAPTVTKTIRVQISEISIEDDSGWRSLDEHRVSQLVKRFKDGEFGMGVLTIPSLRMDQEDRHLLASDGFYKISNGKSVVAALQRLHSEWSVTEMDDSSVGSWAMGALLTAFTEGIRMDLLKFQDDDDDVNRAWWALQHDEDLLCLKKTSLSDKIKVYSDALSKAMNDKSRRSQESPRFIWQSET